MLLMPFDCCLRFVVLLAGEIAILTTLNHCACCGCAVDVVFCGDPLRMSLTLTLAMTNGFFFLPAEWYYVSFYVKKSSYRSFWSVAYGRTQICVCGHPCYVFYASHLRKTSHRTGGHGFEIFDVSFHALSSQAY